MDSTQGLWLAAPPITISFGCALRIEGAETIANALTPAPLSAVLRVIIRNPAMVEPPFVPYRIRFETVFSRPHESYAMAISMQAALRMGNLRRSGRAGYDAPQR